MLISVYVLKLLNISIKILIILQLKSCNFLNASYEIKMKDMNDLIFISDNSVQTAVENYANQAVTYASDNFNIKLDWSDESIQKIEIILDHMHKQVLLDRPSFEDMFSFAKIFGSYIGEVYRRNYGATWGLFTWGNEVFPGVKSLRGTFNFWPWTKVLKRIEEGSQENVWDYYQIILNSHL